MYLIFTWIYFLQTALFFCALAQDDETPVEQHVTEELNQEDTPPTVPGSSEVTESPVTDATESQVTDVGNDIDSTVIEVTDANTFSTVMEVTTTSKTQDVKVFISHDEKPSIFGSHAYNPITQEFEKVFPFNETVAHNVSGLNHHSPHTTESKTDAAASTKDGEQQNEETTVSAIPFKEDDDCDKSSTTENAVLK